MKTEITKQRIIDSMNLEMAKIEGQKQQKEVVYINKSRASSTATKKNGSSGAANGSVIGASAITGAAISKKKGQGAIIGGLSGATVGAAAGAISDKKSKNKILS